MAAFWFWSIFIINGKKWYWLWFWAALICFAQVYVGKHYPFDILGGSLLGWTAGVTSAKIFEHWAFAPLSRKKPVELDNPGALAE
jgi:undecaprenyl-diphosphatase